MNCEISRPMFTFFQSVKLLFFVTYVADVVSLHVCWCVKGQRTSPWFLCGAVN